MALRKSTRATARRQRARTAAPVRAAAARAVERVLSSPDAFALLIGRLEAEGWRIERAAVELARDVGPLGEETPQGDS
jgi:hydroxyethylthiazole kinase-like sugar kinase family protein